jgi:hypothetical protein
MEQYKVASQLGLRFTTDRGILSVEQLWSLNQTQLSNLVKSIKKVLKKDDDDELSFLNDTKIVDVENQLRFDIAKDIYLTKKKSAEELKEKADKKAFEQKILGLIAEKQEDSLRGKSIEELEAMLK